MAIESDGSLFCKFTMIENGRQTTRRVHEMVVQAIDGRTYRLSGKQLPDSVVLLTGASTGGKHFAEVLCDPRIPSPRIFAFLRWPKKAGLRPRKTPDQASRFDAHSLLSLPHNRHRISAPRMRYSILQRIALRLH